jgi:hypothetical protein
VRVHREFRGMTEGVLRVKALEQAVRSAEQAVLSNQKSFQAGSRTTVDVLNAQQQKTTAQRDLAQARYLYLVSRLRLQALAGEDRQASVAQVNSAWCLITVQPLASAAAPDGGSSGSLVVSVVSHGHGPLVQALLNELAGLSGGHRAARGAHAQPARGRARGAPHRLAICVAQWSKTGCLRGLG